MRRLGGYSYVEVLVAAALIAVALPPALDALGTQVRGVDVGIEEMIRDYRLASRMAEVSAKPFIELQTASDVAGSKTTPTLYSDPVGTEDRLVVFIWNYDFQDVDTDGNPFTNPSDHLLWVRVEIEDSASWLSTVVTWH